MASKPVIYRRVVKILESAVWAIPIHVELECGHKTYVRQQAPVKLSRCRQCERENERTA